MNSWTSWLSRCRLSFKRTFASRVLAGAWETKVPAVLLGFLIPEFFKKWFESDPKWPIFLVVSILLVVLARQGWLIAKQNQSAAGETEAARIDRHPEIEAELLVSQSGEEHLVVGNTIELDFHLSLTRLGPLEEIGWPPSGVKLNIPTTGARTFEPILDAVGGLNRALSPPNRKKYGLSRTSFITEDSDTDPELFLYQTDYFTQKSVFDKLESSLDLRNHFGSLDPTKNQVPNAISLQAVVLFRNGDVLCMPRDIRANGQGGKWSISFEEQLKEDDFNQDSDSPGRAESLFRRAFIEEVYGAQSFSHGHMAEAWNSCKDRLIAYKLWATFYEVEVAHFQLFGFYWLNMEPGELAQRHKEAKSKGWTCLDTEVQSLFTLSRGQQLALLGEGSALAKNLRNNETAIIRRETLHRTSLYRLWRLSFAMGREGLDSSLTALKLNK